MVEKWFMDGFSSFLLNVSASLAATVIYLCVEALFRKNPSARTCQAPAGLHFRKKSSSSVRSRTSGEGLALVKAAAAICLCLMAIGLLEVLTRTHAGGIRAHCSI